jgi:hypothetical protein
VVSLIGFLGAKIKSESDTRFTLSAYNESFECMMDIVSIIEVVSGFCLAIKPEPNKRKAVKKATLNNEYRTCMDAKIRSFV